MALESFLYMNYFSYFFDMSKVKPIFHGLPLSYTKKTISQEAALTAYRHNVANFGNYVFVNPQKMTVSGVRFEVDYFTKNPILSLSLIMETQKISPLLWIDADYNGFLFMNSYTIDKGNDDLFGIYTLNFTMYNIDILASIPSNDLQFSTQVTNAGDIGSKIVHSY